MSAEGSAEGLRVIVADDAVLLREGVASLLGDAGFRVIGQAGDAEGSSGWSSGILPTPW